MAGVFEQLEEILAQKNFSAAESQNEDASLGHLLHKMFDLRRRHLAVIVVIEITMDAALVAAISQVDLNAERDIPGQRFVRHLLHELAHRASPAGGFRLVSIGVSESCMISWRANSRARFSASCRATPGSTSNSGQMRRATISSSGVVPSADCQRMVAVRFRVKRVESRPDMIIISPSRLRAAARGLRNT